MRTISAAEAARSFMAILKAAESGEEVVITRSGKPVARLLGAAGESSDAPSDPAAKRRLRSIGWRNHS